MTVVSHQIKQHSNVHCSQANCIYDLWPLCFHSSYWLSTKFAVEHGLSFCFILALLLFLLFSGECNAVRSASFFFVLLTIWPVGFTLCLIFLLSSPHFITVLLGTPTKPQQYRATSKGGPFVTVICFRCLVLVGSRTLRSYLLRSIK